MMIIYKVWFYSFGDTMWIKYFDSEEKVETYKKEITKGCKMTIIPNRAEWKTEKIEVE